MKNDLDQSALAIACQCDATNSAPGDKAVTRCPRLCRSGFHAAVVLCASIFVITGGPALAQGVVTALAQDLCKSPPMDETERDRFRRRSDFMLLLEELADDCPDVAMIFLQFETGSIDETDPPDSIELQQKIPPLNWSELAEW